MRRAVGRAERDVGEYERPRGLKATTLLGSLFIGSPPIFGFAQSRMEERQWRGYAPSTPLTRVSGPWTVIMSMGDESLDNAVTVLPELLLPMSLSIIANRRLEQIPADKFDMILPMHSVNPKNSGSTAKIFKPELS
jgi:hypothetical protein